MKGIKRAVHTLDAAHQSMGTIAARAALLLRGKHKPDFDPAQDRGDFVVVKNLQALKFTGKKLDQKMYYRHSGHLGHLKSKNLRKFFGEQPDAVFQRAVLGMLPKNTLWRDQIKRLKVSL